MQNAPRHSAILLTCIKRLSVLQPYIWSSFEWPLKTGFTVLSLSMKCSCSFQQCCSCQFCCSCSYQYFTVAVVNVAAVAIVTDAVVDVAAVEDIIVTAVAVMLPQLQ